jgi:hypothetical protein
MINTNLYLNPLKAKTLTSTEVNVDKAYLFNVFGDMIKMIPIHSETGMDLSGIKPGIYFTVINGEKRKVIKEQDEF